MIHEIAPMVFYNQYIDKKVQSNSFILLFENQTVLLRKTDEKIDYPQYEEIGKNLKNTRYLFSIDDIEYFLGELKDDAELPEDYQWESIQIFRKYEYGYQAFAGITAHQLYQWYDHHRVCGKCKTELVHSKTERMLECPHCKQTVYPQICPAVIVAITNGNQLLLTKYAHGNYKRYALVAGFAEIGESIEETVKREVMEEVGLHVKNIKYYKSQPWSFTGTLLFGFFAQVDGSTEIKMDRSELAVAEWVNREDVPHGEQEISLTREMMNLFFEGKE